MSGPSLQSFCQQIPWLRQDGYRFLRLYTMIKGMKLSETMESDSSVEETFAAHCDAGVREEACRRSGAASWEVSILPTADGGVRIQVDRSMPPNVPDHFKRFVGERIDVRQVEEWSAPDGGGSRTAKVKVTIKGQPASMVGVAVLKRQGTGSVEVLEGDVKVAVPIIGKKFEPEIANVIISALRVEQQVGQEWVKSRR